jgi:hypothetical protein
VQLSKDEMKIKGRNNRTKKSLNVVKNKKKKKMNKKKKGKPLIPKGFGKKAIAAEFFNPLRAERIDPALNFAYFIFFFVFRSKYSKQFFFLRDADVVDVRV